MGKTAAFKDVKFTIKDALLRCNETFEFSSLDEIHDPDQLAGMAKRQIENLRKMSRSLEMIARYHQGRAFIMKKDIPATKYEKDLSERVYTLFLGNEWILGYYYGKPIEVGKLTYVEIAQLKEMMSDPINGELGELLDFTGIELRSGVEPSSEGYQDVTPDLETHDFAPDLDMVTE